MRVNLLGELTLATAEGKEAIDQSPLADVLLARLAFARGAVPRSELRRCLWPDQEGDRPPSGGDDSLNNYASAVRRSLGFVGKRSTPVRSIPGGSMVLDRLDSPDPKATVKIETDLDEFRRDLRVGELAQLRHALSLVRGPFLAGIDGERFPWLEQARAKVEQDCANAARKLTGAGDAAADGVAEFFNAPDGTLLDALEPLLEPGSAPEPQEPELVKRRPLRPRWARNAVAGVMAVATITIFLSLVLDREGGEGAELGPSGRAGAVAGEMSTSAEYNLAAGLRIANRTLGDRWATDVKGDPTDRLAFALTLENRAPVESYPLVAWTQHENEPEVPYAHQVRLLIATPSGEVLMETPWVRVRGWTNQFGAFYVMTRERAGRGVVRSASGDVLRTLRFETGAIPYRTPDELWGQSELELGVDGLPLGRLESGERVMVEFVASWEVSNDFDSEKFGNLDPTFEANGSSAMEPLDIGSAQAGDRLTFYVLLDNQGNYPTPSRIRVDFRPRKGGRYIEMRTFAIQYDRQQMIGTTTINSGDGRPISLRPVRNSTQLLSHPLGSWVYHPDCPLEEAPTDSRRLEEGIALGGVDIGEFGGFTPHGNCAGIEFNKQLRFEAVVMPR
jgi:hypothetical protein